MITQIRVYWENNPLFNNIGQSFTIGVIDDDGVLISIPNNNVQITIIEPVSAQLINNNSTVIVSPSITDNITLRMRLVYQDYIQYVSYILVPPSINVSLNQIYNNLVNLLPRGVYSSSQSAPSSTKQMAIANVIYQLYNNGSISNPNFTSLSQILKNIFPINGDPNWELFLTGNNRLLYQDATQYGALLQLIYQVEINNNTNPYWLAYNLSKYIFLWLGIQKYVYVSESIIPNIKEAFILNNNSLGHCVLNGSNQNSQTVIFYVLTSIDIITSEQQAQIYQFARQITRAGMAVQVIFTESANDLGLIIDLSNTYWRDPRQNRTYCIQYNQGILDQALGLTGRAASSILKITDFIITLNPGDTITTLIIGQVYQVVIAATPIPHYLPQTLEYYTAFFSSNVQMLKISFIAGFIYFTPLVAGNVTVNVYLGIIPKSYTYTIVA